MEEIFVLVLRLSEDTEFLRLIGTIISREISSANKMSVSRSVGHRTDMEMLSASLPPYHVNIVSRQAIISACYTLYPEIGASRPMTYHSSQKNKGGVARAIKDNKYAAWLVPPAQGSGVTPDQDVMAGHYNALIETNTPKTHYPWKPTISLIS